MEGGNLEKSNIRLPGTFSLLGHQLAPPDEHSTPLNSFSLQDPIPFKKDEPTRSPSHEMTSDSSSQPCSLDLLKKFMEQLPVLSNPPTFTQEIRLGQNLLPPTKRITQEEFVETLKHLSHRISFLLNLTPLIYQERGSNENASQLQTVASSGLAALVSQLSTLSANLLPYLTPHTSDNQHNLLFSESSAFSALPNQIVNHTRVDLNAFHTPTHQGRLQQISRSSQHPSTQKDELQSLDLLNNVNKENAPAEDEDEGENETEKLSPRSYELVEMDAVEILAEHTHFCDICGKGFKRDANLRMHMRGHGDEYKTPAALARPDKQLHEASIALSKIRRYSCPYSGCKRNKAHKKFMPLKTMLCVKNHYRRSHCPKMLTCSKCNSKKFSVVADLKTHEKHCGKDKWLCSCGTTFSRKDKLLGHLSLFAGHVSATPLNASDENMDESVHGNKEAYSFTCEPPFRSSVMSEPHEIRFQSFSQNNDNSTNSSSIASLKTEENFLSDVSLSLGSVHSKSIQQGRLQNFFA